MSNSVKLSCSIATNDPAVPLGLVIYLNDLVIFDLDHVVDTINFEYDMPDDDGEHCLKFIMKNKTIDHTQIDSQGTIVKDARLQISDLAFDEIKLGQIFIEQALYEHDFNGTGSKTQTKFYGEMGCNGTVSLCFATPLYLWLLENM
jgi:hypothetical protein